MVTERNFIKQNVKRMLLREFIKGSIERAGFGGIEVKRNPMGTKIKLTCERPGMIIGKKGKTIKELTETLQTKFEIENPQVEVEDVKSPNLNPHIMAYKLANAIEKGWHFRRAGHSTLRRIMEAGARGAQIVIAGKLTGQRHRTEKFKQGHIKFCGDTKDKWMKEGRAIVKKKLGLIGIKVQIMDSNARLPDEVKIMDREQWEIKKVELQREKEEAKAKEEESTEAVKEFLKNIKEASKTKKKTKKKATKKKTKTEDARKEVREKAREKAEKQTTKRQTTQEPERESVPDAKPVRMKTKPEPAKLPEPKPELLEPKPELSEPKPEAAQKAKEDGPELEICIYCGSTDDIQEGHLMAPSKGGQTTVPACAACNHSKGDKALMEWLRWVKENREERWKNIAAHHKGKRSELAQKVHKIRDEPVKAPETKPERPPAAVKSKPAICVYCGSTDDIQEGHLMAPGKGGQKTVAACAACNRSKGDKALMEWLRWVRENREERWKNIVAHHKGKRSELAQKVRKIRDEPVKSPKEKAPKQEEKVKDTASPESEDERREQHTENQG